MSNFTNTTRKRVVNSFVEVTKDIIKNPYYSFSNLKETICDYYNINTEKTTLDDYTGLNYDDIGPSSPIRLNIIKDFFLYSLEKINLTLEYEDNGLEGNEITGDAIILPDTITPYVGDYFKILHLDKQFLFVVTEVQTDTLNDGANAWKISYKLDRFLDKDEINNLDYCTLDIYNYIITNQGTKFKTLIKHSAYTLLESLDNINVALKTFYKELFYSEKVQTFIFEYEDIQCTYFYDAYLIEFLRKNELLKDDGNKFLMIDHKLPLPKTFSLDYSELFFRAFETGDKDDILKSKYQFIGKYIDNPISIFSNSPHRYFRTDYRICIGVPSEIFPIINAIPDELIIKIQQNKLYDLSDTKAKYNLIIKYFNEEDINIDDISIIEKIKFNDNEIELFYLIPLLIFVIDFYIKKLLV